MLQLSSKVWWRRCREYVLFAGGTHVFFGGGTMCFFGGSATIIGACASYNCIGKFAGSVLEVRCLLVEAPM